MTEGKDKFEESHDPERRKKLNDLRQRAEKVLRQRAEGLRERPTEDLQNLIHELEVHQVELETQNEELRRIQHELEQTRDRYIDLYDFAPVGYVTFSKAGMILAANLTAATMLEVPREQLMNRALSRFIAKEDQDIYYLHHRQLFKGQAPQSYELRMRRENGALFWVHIEAHITTVEESGEKQTVCRAILNDVTQRVEAEKTLRNSEKLHRVTMENIIDPLFLTNDAGEFTFICANVIHILGYTKEELRAMGNVSKLIADDLFTIKELEAQQEISNIECVIPDKQNREHVFLVNVKRVDIEEGTILYTCHDITRRQQAEAALRKSEERFRTLAELSPAGIYLTDLHGNCLYVNPKWLDIAGMTIAEATGDGWEKSLYVEDRDAIQAAWHKTIQSGSHWKREYRFQDREGHITWVYGLAAPQFNDRGEITGYVGINIDITPLKRADAVVQRRNQDLALLNQAARTFNATLNPEQVFESVLTTLCERLNMIAGSIWMVEPPSASNNSATANSTLVCRYLSNPQETNIKGWRVPWGQGIVGWAAAHNQSVWIPDTRKDDRHIKIVDEFTGVECRSVLAVPLNGPDGVLGVLELIDQAPQSFNQTDLRIAKSIAATASIAIRNAQLHTQTQSDAKTKALLLREVNHRVKNNLSTILGLLYIEQHRASPEALPTCADILGHLIQRVTSLAQIHRMLATTDWTPLLLSNLAERIIQKTARAMALQLQVGLEVASSSVTLPPSQAHQIALILNELTINTMEHAVTGRDAVQIEVQITQEDDLITLVYHDDGPGYPPEVLEDKHYNTGLNLIQRMVTDTLRGKISLRNMPDGTAAEIQFRVDEGITR